MVADHPQHVLLVALVPCERAQLTGHLGAGGVADAGHDGGQGTAQGAPFVAVIAKAHVHQQPADVGIAQTQRAEIIAALRDFFAGELRHHHADFQRHGPQTCRMHIGLGVEPAVIVEFQQVHRRQIASRIIEEHVFRTRV